jgi:transposase
MTAVLALGRWPVQQYPYGLTHREALMVRGVVAGLMVKEVAARIDVTKPVADLLVKAAKRKAGAPTLPALAVAWVRATEVPQAYERGKAEGNGRMAA